MDAKERITQLLRERGWSIYELAKRSGLSSTTIANMYKRNTQPTIPFITIRISSVYIFYFFHSSVPVPFSCFCRMPMHP